MLIKCKRNRGLSARKNIKNHNLKTRMEYSSKSSMTKIDRSRKTCFEICGILKESKTNSKKITFHYVGIYFFRRGIWGIFCNMTNIFICRCPNRSGVGAIDDPDRSEQVPDQCYTPDVSEKIFTHDISMIRRQKTLIFDVLKVFTSNFTYYNLY